MELTYYQTHKDAYKIYNRKKYLKYREQLLANAKEKMFKEHFGGVRELVLLRDNESCVSCGMTRQEHRERWNRDITVDHIIGHGVWDKEGSGRHTLSNLQTLCSICHGKKDIKKRSPFIRDNSGRFIKEVN